MLIIINVRITIVSNYSSKFLHHQRKRKGINLWLKLRNGMDSVRKKKKDCQVTQEWWKRWGGTAFHRDNTVFNAPFWISTPDSTTLPARRGVRYFLCSCRRHPCLLPSSISSSFFSFYQVRGIELFRGMNRTNERESLHMAFSPINAPLVLRNFLFLQLKKEEKRKAPILSLRLHDPWKKAPFVPLIAAIMNSLSRELEKKESVFEGILSLFPISNNRHGRGKGREVRMAERR